MEVGENYQMTKATQHYACRPLVARIAELEAMVKDAYSDGWGDGYNTSSLGDWEVDWRDSETCKRLTGEE